MADIGTGAGIFAMLACQFGALKVYAIDLSDAIHVAREIAAANGYADRIECIHNISTELALSEKADVIISDLRGVLPLFQKHLPAIADARKRLLAPDGVLIPQRDILWGAIVEVPKLYEGYTTPWTDNNYSIDMRAARQLVTNTWRKWRAMPDQLLVEPQCLATINYTTVESPDVSAEMTWTLARPGTAHGIVLWFDSVLAEGIEFSNAPGKPELIYGNAFFPLTDPVNLVAGDTVSLKLQANLVGDDYIWRWDTCILAQGHPDQVKADFRQSTLFGAPLSPAQLRKRSAGFVPKLNEDGRADQFILKLMAEETPLGEIARQVSAQFPSRFATTQQALTRVGELSLKYSL